MTGTRTFNRNKEHARELAVRGKSPPWPLPANAGGIESTWATPQKAEVFGGRSRRIVRRQTISTVC
jgi:hypothetical protein